MQDQKAQRKTDDERRDDDVRVVVQVEMWTIGGSASHYSGTGAQLLDEQRRRHGKLSRFLLLANICACIKYTTRSEISVRVREKGQ